MDRPELGTRVLGSQRGGTSAGEAPTEAHRCGQRLVALTEGLQELLNRLDVINTNVCGSSRPQNDRKDPEPSKCLSALVQQAERLLNECNHLARAIEANID
jgi:hypothetical protein